MMLTIALLSAIALAAPVAILPATEQQLMQSALDLVLERNESLGDGLVLLACGTGEIAATGGVPLKRDELWQDQLERNATAVVLAAKLPQNWRSFDEAEFRSAEGLDWQRVVSTHPGAKAVVRVSRPGLSPDGRHAVVQVEVLLPDGMRGWHVYWLDHSRAGWAKVDHRTAWAPIDYTFPQDARWELASRARAN